MRGAIRITVTILGLYVALLGILHGYSELQQGNVSTEKFTIYALGAPCQPGEIWHDCLPALTLLPTFTLAGMATLIVSACVLLWVLFFFRQQRGGWIMLLLALALLLVGGGFVAMFVGMVAGFVATRIHHPNQLPGLLESLWPGVLIVYIVWGVVQWVVGSFFNEFLLSLGGMAFLLDMVLLLLVGLSTIAAEYQQQTGAQVANPV